MDRPSGTVLRRVELADGRLADVRLRGGVVAEIAPVLRAAAGEDVVDGQGGALLPGLHDHHLHLAALAAARASVDCTPRAVHDRDGLAAALAAAARAASPGTWVRGTGYHESVAGDLDAAALDVIVADRPIRVQHRSGALWMLNSTALAAVGLTPVDSASTGPSEPLPDGVERDATGRPTGRLWRLDSWLRERIGPSAPPDIAAVGRELAEYGITGVTDATPDLAPDTVRLLREAMAHGRLPQRVHLLGADGTDAPSETDATSDTGRMTIGPAKLLPPDHDLWPYPELIDRIRAKRHTAPDRWPSGTRPVAVHCVTVESLVLLLTALREVGSVPGDRIEHGAVIAPDMVPQLRELGLRVVTQPGFIADRGDTYRTDTDPADRPHLYPYARLVAGGVPVAASSDAPFGPVDPWAVWRAARDRRTPDGHHLAAGEAVPVTVARDGYLSPAQAPGGPPRRVAVGAPADLCLLRTPWEAAVREPSGDVVRGTWCGGRMVYEGAGG